MKSIQISNKFKNLSILLLAKEEHKIKFGKGRLHTINYDINLIGVHQEIFINCLGSIMEQKYQKYITERKITIPKLDDITEYNPDECCPVCFETFSIDDDGATIAEGANCNHIICRECYMKIATDTNRCPICREKLENTTTDDDTETDDSYNSEETDEDDYGFGNDNQRPTERLFVGRRWFNTETRIIEYYDGSSWTETFVRFDTMFRFLMRNMGFSENGLLEDCCQSCGIQRTTEVNDYMNDGRLGTLREGNYFYYGGCYTCEFIYSNLENHFNNMPYPYSINTTPH